ncbi:choice-of-anchor L domain-containing protein [Sanyastnella coralliicola]|uniref:choice-of-anchor L domain-containing protein n=1 Tax=Sanyastnella coralliicola TaxID=3069118 RepID=UPI0027B9E026|nr:choice-of-anchor L domain-containing protein [Longitalea sp. SCSIO 12813]
MKQTYFCRRLLTAIVLFLGYQASGQLAVDFDLTPEEMAQNLVGTGVEIFNVQVTAADSAYAYYTSTGTEIGTSEGILLTTGNALNAIGPNDETGLPLLDGTDCLNCDDYDNMFPGSELLTLANGGLTTWDATTFEFDVVVQGDSLKFDFNFASEEYLEWVGSSFNDVFGFFISGPNVGVDVNIALIPGTSEAVAINNVNHIDNTQYFFDNQDPLGLGVQYDGFTTGIRAEVGDLIPCETYHLKLIIADGSDRLYDSGVFVSQLTSNPITITTSTVGGTDYMVEGCNQGTVQFESTFVPIEDLEVNFTIDGTAEFDVDYTTDPDLNLVYDDINDVYTLIIPAGETSVSFDILTIFDGLVEGEEIVTVSLVEQQCDGFEFQSSVDFAIIDEITASVDPAAATICNGQCVDLDGEADIDGNGSFEWSPLDGITDPNSLDIEVCPTTTTTYTLTYSLADCEATASATVTVTEPVITFDVTNITCIDGDSGEIDVTVTDATGPITYEWEFNGNPFSTDEDLTGLEEGTYCVTIVDAEGCTSTACVDVTEEDVLNIIDVNFSDFSCFPISCSGECDGTIEVTVEGGTGVYSFEWVDELDNVVGNAAFVDNLCAGDYTVTVTDENGCEVTETYTVNEPDVLDIELAGQVNILCSGEETGVATVTATGGCPPYFYNWSHDPDLTAPVATDLGTGVFTVTVTDSNGCTSDDSVTITITGPGAPISVNLDAVSNYPGGFNVSCPDASDGSIDVSISGGTPGYITTWINTDTGDTYFTEDLSGVPCGSYVLTVTDANDCSETLDVELTCVPAWNVTADVTPNPCGDPNAGIGEIDLTIAGSHGGPYTVSWVGPSCPCVGEDLTGLDSGVYTATITDALGCETTVDVNVGTNDEFDVTATVTPAECGNECSGSIEVDIIPADVDAISWTGPDGFASSDEEIFDLCAGSYILTVVDGDCEEQFVYVITEPDPIVIDFQAIVPPICFGQNNGSVTADASGGVGPYTYEWAPSPECFFGGSNSPSITNLFECTYVVTVTDDTGCQHTDSIFLDAPQVMDIFVSTTIFDGGYNVSCPDATDGQISVTVSGGTPDCTEFAPECYNYDWTGCDPVNIPGVSFQDNLPAGTYCVVVTDDNGCIATTEIPMIEPDPIETSGTISDYNGFGVSCNGSCDGTITPNVTGGSGDYVVYEWITGDIGDNDPEAVTLTDLCPGTYELRIVDTNDCEDIIEFVITEPTPIDVSIDFLQDVSCFDYSDGQATVTATGGAGGYTYDWNDGEYSGNVLIGVPADSLELVVTDLNGCTDTSEVVIAQPDTFLVNLFVPTLEGTPFNIPCFGDSTGSIITTIEGGEPDFTIVWTGDAIEDINLPNQDGLPAGTYEILVTDADGCEATATAEITEPDTPLEVVATPQNPICNGECTGSIDLEVSGGVGPYTYLWELDNDGGEFAVTEDIEDLCPGFYEVLVADANGCDTLLAFVLTEPTPIELNATFSEYEGGMNISCADACDGEITIAPTGGVPDYTIEWTLNGNPAGNGTTLSDICADDIVSVLVTDANGCEIEQVFNLNVPEPLNLNATVSDISCFGDLGSIDLDISGGTAPYTVTWDPAVGDEDGAFDLEEGEYCVTVVDANGCEIEECWTLTEPEELTVEVTGTAANCGACDGTVLVDVDGGTGQSDIEWDGPTDVADGTVAAVDLCPGDYTITITDENDCTVVVDWTVPGPDPIIVDGNVTNPLCFGDCDGAIDATVTNGVAPLTYSWTDAEGNEVSTDEDIDGICNGTFTLSIEDASGCTGDGTFTVVEPDSITINGFSPILDSGYNVSEFGGNDGSIDTEVEGGTPGYTYEWSGPLTIEDGTEDPTDLVAGDYTLTIIDANGCVKDSIIVVTQPDDITLPTGVSPNGDNANDTYVILGIDQHPNNTFKVFNRWGNIVYEKQNYANEWNGVNSDGEDLPDGTYYVVFEADNRQFATYVDLRR